MNKLKIASRLVIYPVTLIILIHFISSCKIQNSEQINQKKEEVIQKRENINEKEKKNQRGEKKREPFDIWAKFVPTGWMGDGEQGTNNVQLFEAWRENPHSPPVCIKIVYRPGPKGWAGIYWQNKPNSWGDKPGVNFQKMGYKKLTFWAKGEKGGEVVEFKAGGINAPGKMFRDSFDVSTGRILLEKEWKQYTIDLEDEDLSSVIGGFCWVASKSGNPRGLIFYLDDVYYTF